MGFAIKADLADLASQFGAKVVSYYYKRGRRDSFVNPCILLGVTF